MRVSKRTIPLPKGGLPRPRDDSRLRVQDEEHARYRNASLGEMLLCLVVVVVVVVYVLFLFCCVFVVCCVLLFYISLGKK